jgi:carbonic anhydrase/acetyltransferase-like protein (isoleucine patch superfamily)
MEQTHSNPFLSGVPLFVAPSASVTGKVFLGEDASLWHNTTLRGDIAPIYVGARTNIQDGAVLHVAEDLPCRVGQDVTVGHGAIVHACTVGDRCIIGMGSIILNGAAIAEDSIVGAGALVTEGKSFPPRSLIIGSPAKAVRSLRDDEVAHIRESASIYCNLAKEAAVEAISK